MDHAKLPKHKPSSEFGMVDAPDFLPYKQSAPHPVVSAPFKALKCFCLLGYSRIIEPPDPGVIVDFNSNPLMLKRILDICRVKELVLYALILFMGGAKKCRLMVWVPEDIVSFCGCLN